MRWLIALVLAMAMVTPALAGEDPYIAIVGNDCVKYFGNSTEQINGTCNAKPWYLSYKYQQFMYDQDDWDFAVPVCDGDFPSEYDVAYHPYYGEGCEQFRSRYPVNQAEVCWTWSYRDQRATDIETLNKITNYNAVTEKGTSGYYEWYVRLPKTPSTSINLVLQCGVLKPNTYAFLEHDAVSLCAGETGEKLGTGFCTRAEIRKGYNPVDKRALPKITAIAYPGPYSVDSNGEPLWTEFNLTAYKNPGSYNPFMGRSLVNGDAAQVLDGSESSKILLKSCLDKTILVKLPQTGQLNGNSQVENELVAGDLIYVRMDIPETNTMDIYCHEQSLKVMGIGGSPF
jgi:hypothetical protein